MVIDIEKVSSNVSPARVKTRVKRTNRNSSLLNNPRVAAVKAAIANGSYKVDSKRLAEKLLLQVKLPLETST